MSENSGIAKAKEKSGAAARKKTSGGQSKPASAEASLNMEELRELAELVNDNGFTDFEFENENIRVRLSKQVSAPIMQQYPAYQAAPPPVAMPAAKPEAEAPGAAVQPDEDVVKITSPIVGTFFRSPGPDKDPYVKEGTTVSPESVVCIVEAMKLMNEILAEVSGEITRIYVEDGQPVEYGQPLFGVKK
jgi:acetyl-CoA carboxylase biotin carboxyl carrier protein